MRRWIKNKLGARSKALIRQCLYLPWKPRDWLVCCWHGLKWDQSWRFYGLPLLQMHDRGSIEAGAQFCLVSNWRKNSIGVLQPVILKTVRPGAKLRFGNNVGISGSTISATTAIEVGNDVLIGSGCLITDSDAHALSYKDRGNGALVQTKPIQIEDGVFIGARSIILKGVTIGRGSVIGAGSVVSRDVPPGVIAAGNPANVIRKLP